MKASPCNRAGLTWLELVVVVAIVVILAVLVIPPDGTGSRVQGQLTQSLNNAKQIHLATTRMVLDHTIESDPKLGWPGDLPDVKNMGDFAERLVEGKYFERGDLKSTFHAPGVEAYIGTGPFTSKNSAFKIYKVTANDVGPVLFIATKNFTFGQPLDRKMPFGKKGAVIVRKSGEGLKITDQQALQSSNGGLGLMPGATTQESPGSEVAANVLE